MNDIRSKFEEIWPVPEGVEWDEEFGEYMRTDKGNDRLLDLCLDHDLRLDTFTRCQETTALYVGIIDELIEQMTVINELSCELPITGIARESIGRAKQKLEQIK